MRISIFGLHYSPEVTGNAPYTSGMAAGLAKRGHKVEVLSGYPHYPAWKIDPRYTGFSDRESVDGVTVRRLRQYVPKVPNLSGRVLLETTYGARIASSRWGSPDVILCVSPALISTAMAIGRNRIRRNPIPFGVVVQDLYSLGVMETGVVGSRAARAAARFEALVLRSADGVAVVHDKFRKYSTGQLGVPDSRITTIRNWTHLKPTQLKDRQQTRSRYGWGEKDTVVLHAGNMGLKQGLGNVIDAARLADADTDTGGRVIFVLLGDGNQRELLKSRGADVKSLQFIDPLPDAEFQAVLAAADILLVNEMPGVTEMSVPSKLTSYFSMGKPVLAASSEKGTTAIEIARSNGGIRIDPGNPRGLLMSARSLANDPALAERLGHAGKQYCNDHLSENSAIDQYDSWINDLVRSWKGKG